MVKEFVEKGKDFLNLIIRFAPKGKERKKGK